MEKLKEIHLDVIQNNHNLYNEELLAKLVNITRKVAIDFSLWQQMGDCIWVLNDEDYWVHPYTNESITTEELFDEFLKTYEI